MSSSWSIKRFCYLFGLCDIFIFLWFGCHASLRQSLNHNSAWFGKDWLIITPQRFNTHKYVFVVLKDLPIAIGTSRRPESITLANLRRTPDDVCWTSVVIYRSWKYDGLSFCSKLQKLLLLAIMFGSLVIFRFHVWRRSLLLFFIYLY